MTDRRGLLGGISLAIAGVPLVFTYGIQSFGYLGVVLVAVGVVFSYGAWIAE
jgi:hypothetical protein